MKQTIQQRRLKFLKEGVDFFSKDTRRRAVVRNKCIVGGQEYRLVPSCVYRTRPTGNAKKCFIGRYIPDERYSLKLENLGVSSINFREILPEEVLELGDSFLFSCQHFHDDSENRNKRSGLSLIGKGRLRDIVKEYC